MSTTVNRTTIPSSSSKNFPTNILQKKGRPLPCYANADERKNYLNAKIEVQTVARFTLGEMEKVNNTLYIAVPKKIGTYFYIHPNHNTSSPLHPTILTERNMTRLQKNIETRKFSTRIISTNEPPQKSFPDFSLYKMIVSLPSADSGLSNTLGRASPGWDASFNPDTIKKSMQHLKADINTKEKHFNPIESTEKNQDENSHFIDQHFSLESISSISSSEEDELKFTEIRVIHQLQTAPPFITLPIDLSTPPKLKKNCCEKLMDCFYQSASKEGIESS